MGTSKKKTAGKRRKSAKRETGKKPLAVQAPKAQLLLAAPSSVFTRLRSRIRASFAVLGKRRHALAESISTSWARKLPVIRRGLRVSGIMSLCLIGLAAIAFGYTFAIADRILPRTEVGGISIGWQTPEVALTNLKAQIAGMEAEGVPFLVNGRTVRLHPTADLGIVFQPELAIQTAMSAGRTGDIWEQQSQRLSALASPSTVALPMQFDAVSVAAHLKGQIPELAEQPIEPKVIWQRGAFVVVPGASAHAARINDVLASLRTVVERVDVQPIELRFVEIQPGISLASANKARERGEQLLGHTVTLAYKNGERGGPWKIDLAKDPFWLHFGAGESGTMAVSLDPDRLKTFILSTVAASVNQEHVDAHLTHASSDSWRVTVVGSVKDGHELQQQVASDMIQQALSAAPATPGDLAVELPVNFEPGHILDETGRDMGLRDMLANGRSNFSDSPAGRDYNVRKGMRIFNGILIPQGEDFAFNSFLGPVDGAHGWRDALAIFNGGLDTRMDPGGGICQVSTTVYQAAVKAGLKVKVRNPHSYFVSYYAKAPGLMAIDATVYPGSQDLIFTNDTPGPVLKLAGSEGVIAYVQLFGTKDRTVALHGPSRGGNSSATPIYKVDASLAPGAHVVDHNGHAGFSVSWQQVITFDDGRVEKNMIYSNYKAVPTQGRVGPAAGEATVAAN